MNVIAILDDTMTLYTPDTVVCRGQTFRPTVTGNPLITYQWTPTAGIATPNLPNPNILADTSAMYIVKGIYPGCPDIVDSFYLDVQPNPVVNLEGKYSVCKFDTIHLHPTVVPNWYTHYIYSWTPATFLDDPNVSSVVFKGGDSMKLVLTVTTPHGCIGIDSTLINVYPGNFAKLDTSVIVCPRDSVQLTASGASFYRWHPGIYLDDSMSATPWVHAVTSQSYTVVATSQYGCHDTVSANVTVRPNAVLNLGDSVTLSPGESYHIQPGTNCVSFAWFPPAGLNNFEIADPIATPEVSTLYVVHGKTEWGCLAVDSISIHIDAGALYGVPNAFTPGGSVNAKLLLIKRGDATLNFFRIFNRWGNMVFETKNIEEGWDGKFHGVPQPFGVFVYQLEATAKNGKIFQKHGNVTLIR